MRKINKINITETSYEIFENIVSSKRWENKILLDWISSEIKDLYKNFIDNESELFNMNPKWYNLDTKDALIHCYESDTTLTKSYKHKIKSLEDRKCPYCYLENSSQVEHYLPKDEFPEFSFMIDNLFPCCSTCNTKKWTNWRDLTSRIILNFYSDLIPEEQFLYVDLIIIDNIPIVEFKIDTSKIIIDSMIEKILYKHIERLNLLNRYSESINNYISELKNRVRLSKWITESGIRSLCKDEAEVKRLTYGNNYFVTVLYDEISKNDGMIELLFIN